MTLREFADKLIVRAVASLTCWISFFYPFIFEVSSFQFKVLFIITALSIIAMAIINYLRGIEPPASSDQSWGERTVSDPIYHHLPGNVHHHR